MPIVETYVVEPMYHYICNNNNNSDDEDETGFPFDDSDSSDHHFQSKLDDIAKRHPEFAQHLNPLSSSSNDWPRSRTSSGSSQHGSPRTGQDYFGRFRNRPFGSRFDDFTSPFDNFDDDPRFARRNSQDKQQQQHQQQQQDKQKSDSQPREQAASASHKPPQVPREEKKPTNIQQSNTVDLGQPQEPVADNRNQRSMSAPPENRNTGKRFTSSIHIPNLNAADMGGSSSTQQQQQQQQQTNNKPNERIIPIHIEGRDEPVLPKNTFTQPQQQPSPHPPQQHQHQQQPEAERIFGQRPSMFTQFLNRGEPQPDDYRQQDEMRKAQQQQKYQDYQRQKQDYERQQEEEFQRQKQQQQQENLQKTAPAAAASNAALEVIQKIQKDVSELMMKVEKFAGKSKDKEYIYLDEMLTRNLLKLDNIETEGKDTIRQARREAIKCIQECIKVLESKANVKEIQQENVDKDVVADEETTATTATKENEKSVSDLESEVKQSENTPMDVDEAGKLEKEAKVKEEAAKKAEEDKSVIEAEAVPSDDSNKEEAKEVVAIETPSAASQQEEAGAGKEANNSELKKVKKKVEKK